MVIWFAFLREARVGVECLVGLVMMIRFPVFLFSWGAVGAVGRMCGLEGGEFGDGTR